MPASSSGSAHGVWRPHPRQHRLLLLESFLFITMALSLGILISSITSSQQVAMLISLVVLMLPTILLSGFIFPVENMPWILQILCYCMPPKYYITIIKSIMLQGNGLPMYGAKR